MMTMSLYIDRSIYLELRFNSLFQSVMQPLLG